ncbi:hypothetical protein ACH5RR_017185 [Cinchona calisaya]|uniref:pyruvate kinase n=1 Tax=Cinchona calisaya TaxID=153742 RepID=A0ABD3A068_9GENT
MWSKAPSKKQNKNCVHNWSLHEHQGNDMELAEAGMNVARLNMSHEDHASHQKVIDLVKDAQAKDNVIAIMLDTKGPEVRSGDLPQPITLKPGQEFTFTIRRGLGTADCVSVNYDDFVNDVEVGDMLLVDGCGADIHVIVKIESADSIPNLHSIITASDGAMVARGDLGAELPIEEEPLLQLESVLMQLCFLEKWLMESVCPVYMEFMDDAEETSTSALLQGMFTDLQVIVNLQKQGTVKEGEQVALVQSGKQPIWRLHSTHNIQLRKV